MRDRIGPRRGTRRHLSWLLAVAAAVSTASLAWVAWQLLAQDAAAQAQRAQDHVEAQADRVVQSIERAMADMERQLSDWVARPDGPAPTPRHGGLVVVVSGDAIITNGSPALLFRPGPPPHAGPAHPRLAEADAAEFGQRDYAKARALLLPLARSTDGELRAAALLRLGRMQRASGEIRQARETFAALAGLDHVRVAGLPAGLAGRVATTQMLAEAGQTADVASIASDIGQALRDGRWAVSEAQFDHYLELAQSATGTRLPIDAQQVALAHAVGALIDEARTGGLPPSGRRPVAHDAGALLALWRTTPDGLVIWIASAAPLLARVQAPPSIDVTASGATRQAGRESSSRVEAVRHASATGLPWTIRATLAGGALPSPGDGRRRLVVLGVGLLVVSLLTGFWLAGRAAQRELELARAQADFVSTVSHEFRTPLAAMRQLSELLASGRVATDTRRQQYYDSLASESRRLQRLVENLLDFGRLQAGARAFTFEPVDMGAVVQRVVDEFRAQSLTRPCAIDIDASSPAVTMRADADALALALHNLLDNAVKYSGDAPHVSVSWYDDGNRVALQVRDHGIGIAPDERTRIFERFVRGAGAEAHRVRGTGIGLAVVKQVVDGHGGEVTVQSTPGTGSTFTLWLPRWAPAHGDAT